MRHGCFAFLGGRGSAAYGPELIPIILHADSLDAAALAGFYSNAPDDWRGYRGDWGLTLDRLRYAAIAVQRFRELVCEDSVLSGDRTPNRVQQDRLSAGDIPTFEIVNWSTKGERS
jgi:hypothetical protein